jgi:thiol-disulfide isomerase/thioredoxin
MAKAKTRKSAEQRRTQQRPQPEARQTDQSAKQADRSQAQASSVSQQRLQRKQQQAHRNERKRPRPNWRPVISVGIVLLVIAGVIGVFVFISHRSTTPVVSATPAGSDVLQAVTNVDQTVLAAVGTGSASAPQALHGQLPLKGPKGKPEFFYFGAEYCPFCAAQRWAVVVALSRFGTFSHLNQTTSSSTDVYPSTPTFTFYQSSYSSPYIDFVSVEYEDNQQNPLQTPTNDQQQLISKYDAPPYVSAQDQGGIPFIDIANQYLVTSSSYSPQVLQGLNWQEIANELSNQNSPVTKGIVGTANYLTAAICQTTNQQPASVCNAPPIPQIEQSLAKQSFGSSGPQIGSMADTFQADVRRSF